MSVVDEIIHELQEKINTASLCTLDISKGTQVLSMTATKKQQLLFNNYSCSS